MKIRRKKYVNATKSFPLEFDSAIDEGDDTELLEEAYLYDTEKEAKDDMVGRFDEPDKRQVIPVIVTYEL
jgi:hypothetical protein